MDLVEFLLARIAEDEEVARRGGESGGFYPDDCWDPARVLAECATKRRIVKAVEDHRDGEWEDDPIHEMVLEPMAAVYANHPDYRPEWEAVAR